MKLEKDLNKYNMDGIDFVPLFWEPYKLNNQPIYKSYTRAEFKKILLLLSLTITSGKWRNNNGTR